MQYSALLQTTSATKQKRVTSSILGGELYALADAFDYGYKIRHDLEQIIEKYIPLKILRL